MQVALHDDQPSMLSDRRSSHQVTRLARICEKNQPERQRRNTPRIDRQTVAAGGPRRERDHGMRRGRACWQLTVGWREWSRALSVCFCCHCAAAAAAAGRRRDEIAAGCRAVPSRPWASWSVYILALLRTCSHRSSAYADAAISIVHAVWQWSGGIPPVQAGNHQAIPCYSMLSCPCTSTVQYPSYDP